MGTLKKRLTGVDLVLDDSMVSAGGKSVGERERDYLQGPHFSVGTQPLC